jgi:hypothetical protein
MAQGSKSRVIIWTIVAILVVVAVVMLVTKPKAASGKPPVNPTRFNKTYERQFARLENRVVAARADYPGASAEQWQEIEEQIALGKQVMVGMLGLTDQQVLEPKRDSVQTAYSTAKKKLKAITGKEDKEDTGD